MATAAAAGAFSTNLSRWFLTTLALSATSSAVAARLLGSLTKGRALSAAPLTLSATIWVPFATSRVPVSSLAAAALSFFSPLLSSPLFSPAVSRPSASSLAPSWALPAPSLSLSAPSAASAVLSCRSEKLTKILSRKPREALADAAERTSEKTEREIEPTT